MPSKCWVVGSAILDTVYSAPRLPQPGESVLATRSEKFLGGKGVNQAIAAARSGASTELFVALGNDSAASSFSELFTHELNLNPNVTTVHHHPTGQASITIDPEGRNQITVFPGANMHLPSREIKECNSQPGDYILCQNEVPDDCLLAAAHAAKLIYNPAPYRSVPSEVLAHCFAITPNETEAAALTGIFPDTDKNLLLCANHLMSLGIQNVIITLGDQGAFFTNCKEQHFFDAKKVKAVDTTAAGDVFNGALIAQLTLGLSITNSIQYATAAATISVTRHGAVPSIPHQKEIEQFLQNGELPIKSF